MMPGPERVLRGHVLLSIARASISRALGLPRAADESAPWLGEHRACFVTLTRHGELRGCIGTLDAHRPLLDDIKSNAIAAAMRDPRFEPLRAGELNDVRVEVSLLSAPEQMIFRDEADALGQLRPGVDGLIFQYGGFRSTFLPQVWEQLPQAGVFMSRLKRKAGLPPDFWAKGVSLSRYAVEKWAE